MTTTLTESYWPATDDEPLEDITLGDLLRRNAEQVPDRVALVEGIPDKAARRRWTYAELLADAERVARALLQRFEPGDRVALIAANCPEWVLLQHGCSLSGVWLVPLNPAYKLAEVETILRSSECAGVFYEEAFRDNDLRSIVSVLAGKLDFVDHTVAISDFEVFAASGDPDRRLPDIGPEDTVQVQYTSGTTGAPKGALLHHKGVVNTSGYVAGRAGFPEGGVWINAMPMFHIGGAAVTEIGCLSRQGTYVLAPGFDPASTLELTESEGGNVMLLVPTMIMAVLDHPDAKTRDLSSITAILSGAAAVPAALVRRTKEELGCEFTILFGQTELNGVVSQTRMSDTVQDTAETLGRPLPHVEVMIADPVTGEPLPVGEVGEICARGYQKMQGYFGMPEATAATIRDDGWLRMGDLGSMDERGFLRIGGRLKDMIIRGGMNLFPREIEDVLFDHDAVAQVTVVGVPDERWGEVVGAVVVPADPASPPDPEELNRYCTQRLSKHKAPVRVFFVDGFPLTPSGKVQKFRLQEQIAAGELQPEDWSPA